VAVRQAEAVGWERVPERTQDARLPDPRLAGDDDALARLDGVDELVDEALLRRRKPEILVVDLLGEGLDGQAEEVEVRGHDGTSSLRGARPTARSTSVTAGSKATRAGWGLRDPLIS